MLRSQVSRRSQIGIAAGAAIVMIGLAACSGQSGDAGSGGNGNGGVITLTEEDYYTSGTANTFWNKAFAEYHKLHPNVVIHRQAVPQTGYVPHMLNQAASSSLPNILMIDNPNVAQFASSGALMPLSQIGSVNTSDIPSSLLSNGLYKGKLYAVPPYENTIALAYNKKLFAAAHLSPPKTWAQLASDAQKLTTPKVYGFVDTYVAEGGGAAWNFEPFLWTNAGQKAFENISSPQSVQALQLLTQLVHSGAMPKAVVTWSNGQDTEYFQKGRAAMDVVGSWMIPSFDSTKGLSYGITEIPTRIPGQTLYVPTGGEEWAISKSATTAQQKAALDFLKWLITPQEDAKEAVEIGGLIPTVKSAVPMALAKADSAHMAPYVTELQNGATERTTYSGTAYDAVSNTIGNAIVASLTGQQQPAQALQSITGQVNSTLKSAGF